MKLGSTTASAFFVNQTPRLVPGDLALDIRDIERSLRLP